LRNTGVAIVDANNGKPQSVLFRNHPQQKRDASFILSGLHPRSACRLIREHARIVARSSRSFTCRATKQPSSSARRVARHSGCRRKRIPVFEYPPKRIKQIDSGARRSRQESRVAFMVRALLGLTETPDADAADALAIALTHLRMHEAAARGLPGECKYEWRGELP